MMKEISFTEEQQNVIDARNSDLLVSAAAGSGKTAVLAERIVRLVSEGERPCDIDRILVVTFTRAAASGMRERIAAALSKRIAEDPENRHLRKQEMLLSHAKIMTIDAFCQYLLRNNFHTIGLDPSFRVSDEGEMRLLEQEAMAEILEEAYTAADPAFLHCMDSLSRGAGDEQAETEILKLYRFSQTMPWPMLSLREILDAPEEDERIFGTEAEAPAWIREILSRIRKETVGCIEELKRAGWLAGLPGGPWMYSETITNDIESLSAFMKADGFQEMYDYLQDHTLFGKLSGKRDEAVRPELREQVRGIRDEVKKAVKKYSTRYFSASPQEFLARERLAQEMTQELVRLTMAFLSRLEEKKQEKNLIDFSDMEHLALRILLDEPEPGRPWSEAQPTKTAAAYAEFFQEVMVDEYQDSNMIQELILDAVSAGRLGRPDRFMVGDIKQSIYRFRLARPEIFAEKMTAFGKDDTAGRRIDLHRNFRSRKEILEAVNAVHERLMAADIGGVDYDEDARLVPGASYPEEGAELPELLLIPEGEAAVTDEGEDAAGNGAEDSADDISDVSRENDPEDDPAAGDTEEDTQGGLLTGAEKAKEEREAETVAERILQLMQEGRVSDGNDGMRPVRFSDIAILLRTTSGVDEIYRDVLTAHGIPVHMESKAGYFHTMEIRLLIQLLHTIENPLRDIPLAAVMHSFLGGFSDEELAHIRTADMNDGHGFYEAVTACAGGGDALAQKCRTFLAWLADLRDRSMRLSVRELLEVVLTGTGYLEIVSAMPGGRRRRANVRMLLIRAADFAASGGHGLAAFTQRLEQYRLADVDLGEASSMSDDADLIHLMSIHKSKGLEFPVVFVSGLSRRFNRSDERGMVLVDEHIGIGAKAVDLDKRISTSTLHRIAISDRLHEESLGEEIRVLYVAMTRAREKLILTGTLPADKAGRFMEELEQGQDEHGDMSPVVPYRERIHAGSFLDLILASLRRGSVPICVKLAGKNENTAADFAEEKEDEGVTRRKTALTSIVNSNDNGRYRNASLREKLGFTYAHSNLADLFVKTTVTELKEKILAEEDEGPGQNRLFGSKNELWKPMRTEKSAAPLTGAERGTACHKIMEILDAEILDLIDISSHDLINAETIDRRHALYEWMKKREEQKRLPEGTVSSVRPEDILAFLDSPLGLRFIRAFRQGTLLREKQFMMGLDASRVADDGPAGEMVLVQGVIDACFTEGESIILLDYKTDHVTGDGTELAQKYGVQLALYAEALERITGRSVSEKWIWSFDLGRTIPVTGGTFRREQSP